jgi:hypothetical protein
MKMIIPNQDKVKRLLLLQLDAQIPEERYLPKRNQIQMKRKRRRRRGRRRRRR